MVAVYPNALKTFAYRQDFTQLVDAADVNVSYDEIGALQKTLGVLPNTDTIDGAVNTWPTVGARISAVREGVTKPYVNVSANNISVPYNTTVIPTWTSTTWNTHNIFQGGTNLICPRTGVYTFDIYIRWHQDGMSGDSQQPVFNRNGKLEIAIQPVNGNAFLTSQTGFFPIGYQKATRQSASINMPWIKGTPVIMMATQQCFTSPLVATALCSITYHRDAPTQGNL